MVARLPLLLSKKIKKALNAITKNPSKKQKGGMPYVDCKSAYGGNSYVTDQYYE